MRKAKAWETEEWTGETGGGENATGRVGLAAYGLSYRLLTGHLSTC